MYRDDCIETMRNLNLPSSVCQSVPLTWRSWLANEIHFGFEDIRRVGALMTLWRFRTRSRRVLADLDTLFLSVLQLFLHRV